MVAKKHYHLIEYQQNTDVFVDKKEAFVVIV